MTNVLVDGAAVDYSGLPENHRDTMRMYIEHGYEPGSGWRAILRHDLSAVLRVDKDTADAMPQILRWLHNYAPAECHGSEGKVTSWIIARRAERMARNREEE